MRRHAAGIITPGIWVVRRRGDAPEVCNVRDQGYLRSRPVVEWIGSEEFEPIDEVIKAGYSFLCMIDVEAIANGSDPCT